LNGSNAARAYACLKTADLNASPLIRTLFALRGLGSRRSERRPLTLDTLMQGSFVLLAERPADEIVLGLIARPWTPRGDLRHVEASEFASFAERGFAKIAWNFKLDDAEGVRTKAQEEANSLVSDAREFAEQIEQDATAKRVAYEQNIEQLKTLNETTREDLATFLLDALHRLQGPGEDDAETDPVVTGKEPRAAESRRD